MDTAFIISLNPPIFCFHIIFLGNFIEFLLVDDLESSWVNYGRLATSWITMKTHMFLQCGAPKIAKLAQIPPISLWFMVRK